MLVNRINFYLILLLFTTSAFAGKVTSLKGIVTLHKLTDKTFTPIQIGSVINYGDVIETKAKSFVKIKFPDKSSYILGPNSKLSITKQTPDSPKILNLLEGRIKGLVMKGQSKPSGYHHKVFVKTRSAILGVRGTEFVTSYNGKNHITSNITLKGEVDLYKTSDELIFESIREELDLTENESTEVNPKSLKEKIEGTKVKAIKKGYFSSALLNEEEAKVPLRISPKQIIALKETNFLTKTKSHKMSVSDLYATYEDKTFDKKTIRHGRDGGLVDLKTGIYISPPENALFDDKNKIYIIPEELGKVDPKTGDYNPPRGLLLDPTEGFILDPHYYGDRNIKENLQSLMAMTGRVNERLNKAVKVFKHITRSDLYVYTDYKYTTNVTENYFGEIRNITGEPSGLLDAKGFFGFQLFHNKDLLIYPKGSLKSKFYQQEDTIVRKENSGEAMAGIEIHRKFKMFGRKSRLIFDSEYKKYYKNRKQNNSLQVYHDTTTFGIKEILSFNKKNHARVFYKYGYFQGFEEENFGELHQASISHRYVLGETYDVIFGLGFSARFDNQDDQKYWITKSFFKGIKKDIFYRTDVSLSFSHEFHKSKNEFPFESAIYTNSEISFHRRLGDFWKLNGKYSYEVQNAYKEYEKRSFNGQSFGIGLTMYY